MGYGRRGGVIDLLRKKCAYGRTQETGYFCVCHDREIKRVMQAADLMDPVRRDSRWLKWTKVSIREKGHCVCRVRCAHQRCGTMSSLKGGSVSGVVDL